ncbi:DUF397 domain-containing protein [Streptomyces oceani]|uniref:DUF397 domain-containing protein n=1 Tax=Streptomyces oceani TaxID=1075402 RepID=A0A1E7KQ17_9ACTN|nr:DUF397 domain-containing protein [Streptomyces oceani]OEV06042.1 hypothetical protein AN216_00800 [Streptomyces oceani]
MSALHWQKSTYSSGDGNTNCLELATAPAGSLHLRESDEPATILNLSRQTLSTFLSGIKTGEHRD